MLVSLLRVSPCNRRRSTVELTPRVFFSVVVVMVFVLLFQGVSFCLSLVDVHDAWCMPLMCVAIQSSSVD